MERRPFPEGSKGRQVVLSHAVPLLERSDELRTFGEGNILCSVSHLKRPGLGRNQKSFSPQGLGSKQVPEPGGLLWLDSRWRWSSAHAASWARLPALTWEWGRPPNSRA